ncbi:hypothetical protein PAPYR_2217 [Paratrimastix pyriformis]|uniref:Uncharacterized protein n=1 Tax=Paratrimastix pyriformis TaxID=342808 RepID=A0ABQ8UPU9_9EUKA|nr:hypothetical protein PAPYR_2217 [Paratrimastix pyriformis]
MPTPSATPARSHHYAPPFSPQNLSPLEAQHFDNVMTEFDDSDIALAEHCVSLAAQKFLATTGSSLIGAGLFRDLGHAFISLLHQPLEGASYLDEAAQWFAGGVDTSLGSTSLMACSVQCMMEAAAARVRVDSLDTAVDTLTRAMSMVQGQLAGSTAKVTWSSGRQPVVFLDRAPPPLPGETPTPTEVLPGGVLDLRPLVPVPGWVSLTETSTTVNPTLLRMAIRIRVSLCLLLLLTQSATQALGVAGHLHGGIFRTYGGAFAEQMHAALTRVVECVRAQDLDGLLGAQSEYMTLWDDALHQDLIQRLVSRMLLL